MSRGNRARTQSGNEPGRGWRRLSVYLALLAGLFLTSALLFAGIEGWSLLDAFYYTMVTMLTIGFGDLTPQTALGKVLTISLAPVGLFLVFVIGFRIMEQTFRELIEGRWRRMERLAEASEGHVIVCGYGRLGTVVVEHLLEWGERVVVVERDEAKARRLADAGVPVVNGDALEERALRRAGIARARALIATFSDDTDNVYLVLEALEIRKDLTVISAASTLEAQRRLRLAGARHVISPILVGGEMLARSVREGT